MDTRVKMPTGFVSSQKNPPKEKRHLPLGLFWSPLTELQKGAPQTKEQAARKCVLVL